MRASLVIADAALVMNFLHFSQALWERLLPSRAGFIEISYEESERLLKTHSLKLMIPHKAVFEGLGRGIATLHVESPLTFFVNLDEITPFKKDRLVFIVGLPRPQMIKRIINFVSTVGMEELRFFYGKVGEKSYHTSKELTPQAIQQNVILGMEQGGNPYPPIITTYPSLLSALLVRHENSLIVYGDSNTPFMASILQVAPSYTYVVIGPERGISVEEKALLSEIGALPLQVGEGVMRVDQAVSVSFGYLKALLV